MTFEEAALWFQSASLSDINTGVGCPFCNHDGPYWISPCRLHEHIQSIAEDHHINERVVTDLSAEREKIANLLGLDLDDDLVGAVRELQSEYAALAERAG